MAIKIPYTHVGRRRMGLIIFCSILFNSRVKWLSVNRESEKYRLFVLYSIRLGICLKIINRVTPPSYFHHFHSKQKKERKLHLPARFSRKRVFESIFCCFLWLMSDFIYLSCIFYILSIPCIEKNAIITKMKS